MIGIETCRESGIPSNKEIYRADTYRAFQLPDNDRLDTGVRRH